MSVYAQPRNGVVVAGERRAMAYTLSCLDGLDLDHHALPGEGPGQRALVSSRTVGPRPEIRSVGGPILLEFDDDIPPNRVRRHVVAGLVSNEFRILERLSMERGRVYPVLRPVIAAEVPRSVNAWARAARRSRRTIELLVDELSGGTLTPHELLSMIRAFRACERRLRTGCSWGEIARALRASPKTVRRMVRDALGAPPSAADVEDVLHALGALGRFTTLLRNAQPDQRTLL